MSHIDLEWEHINLPKLLATSGLGYIIENVVLYPLWLVKTKQQISTTQISDSFAGYRQQFPAIVKQKGFRGLYKGFWLATIGTMPSWHAYLITYHWTKHEMAKVAPKDAKFQLLVPMVAGLSAEVVTCVLWTPIDVVVQKLQLKKHENTKGLDLLKDIVKTKGVQSLYRGLGITLLTYSLYSGVWWAVYENVKTLSKPKHENAELYKPGFSSVLTAVAAGSSALIITQPLDLVKTRIQTFDEKYSKANKYTSMKDGFFEVHRTEGWRGFTRGLQGKLLMKMPGYVAMVFAYEYILFLSVDR